MGPFVYFPQRRGRRPLRLGEGALAGHGGGFFSEPGEEDTGTGTAQCCFILEDGTGEILTEDGLGCIEPEVCPATCCLELEDGSGMVELELGDGCIDPENCV